MKNNRKIFSDKRTYSYTLIFYVCLFCFIIALFDWNLISFFISHTIKINNTTRILFLFINLWIITLFILFLSLLKAKIKFDKILQRLDDISKINIDSINENYLHYRKDDSFYFFASTYNDFIRSGLKRKKNLIKKINNFQKVLEKLDV